MNLFVLRSFTQSFRSVIICVLCTLKFLSFLSDFLSASLSSFLRDEILQKSVLKTLLSLWFSLHLNISVLIRVADPVGKTHGSESKILVSDPLLSSILFPFLFYILPIVPALILFNCDQDPTFEKMIRIRPKNLDPDPKPWFLTIDCPLSSFHFSCPFSNFDQDPT